MKPYPSSVTAVDKNTVEHAFGILANRFRIFQTNMSLSVEKVELVTKTCCLLHNMLSKRNENYLNFSSVEQDAPVSSSTSGRSTSVRSSAAENVREAFKVYTLNYNIYLIKINKTNV